MMLEWVDYSWLSGAWDASRFWMLMSLAGTNSLVSIVGVCASFLIGVMSFLAARSASLAARTSAVSAEASRIFTEKSAVYQMRYAMVDRSAAAYAKSAALALPFIDQMRELAKRADSMPSCSKSDYMVVMDKLAAINRDLDARAEKLCEEARSLMQDSLKGETLEELHDHLGKIIQFDLNLQGAMAIAKSDLHVLCGMIQVFELRQ